MKQAKKPAPWQGIYRHFKGGRYEVLGVGRHSETGESLVFYRALYGKRRLWARPARMFLEKIKIGGKRKPRFQYLKKQAR